MNDTLYMIVELKNGTLIEVYQQFINGEETFVDAENDVVYNSLTEFFVDYLDYQPPKLVHTFVKDIELCDPKNETKVTLSQKRALYNFHVYCLHKDLNFNDFLQWAKEKEQEEVE